MHALVLLDRAEVQRRIAISRSGLYALMARDPSFPRPITLTADKAGRSTGLRWLESAIDAWIARHFTAKPDACEVVA
jgi:predicted DNA-binding transcriptional regulator AlpA